MKKKITIIAAHDLGKTTVAKEAIKCGLSVVVRSCYWCDVPIADNDEVEELPEGRGEAHKKCADEWYGCQMAED